MLKLFCMLSAHIENQVFILILSYIIGMKAKNIL
jgi:hypothetical protein